MTIFKVVLISPIPIIGFLMFLYVRGKPWNGKAYRWLVIAMIIVKIATCLIVYTKGPALNKYSDAVYFYFPQTLDVLSGKIPSRDFTNPWSILFIPFLAGAVAIWRSVGAIVLTVLLMETVMIVAYLLRCRRMDYDQGWRTVFLYSILPFSFYWTALNGYGGVLIACWMMLALISAERGRDVLAGVLGAVGFLTTKLLALLAWPGIIFFSPKGWGKRALILIVSLGLTASLLFVRINVISFMGEYRAMTCGNIWFVISRIVPGLTRHPAWHMLPVITFAAAFIPMLTVFVQKQRSGGGPDFNKSVAFTASTFLVFMVLSKITHNYYIVMSLIFVVHTVTLYNVRIVRNMIPVVFLGAVSLLEQYLWYKLPFRTNVFTTGGGLLLFVLDIAMIFSYIYLLVVCFKVAIDSRGYRSIGTNSNINTGGTVDYAR